MKAVGISADGLLRIGHQSEPPALQGEKPMTWKIAEKVSKLEYWKMKIASSNVTLPLLSTSTASRAYVLNSHCLEQ